MHTNSSAQAWVDTHSQSHVPRENDGNKQHANNLHRLTKSRVFLPYMGVSAKLVVGELDSTAMVLSNELHLANTQINCPYATNTFVVATFGHKE